MSKLRLIIEDVIMDNFEEMPAAYIDYKKATNEILSAILQALPEEKDWDKNDADSTEANSVRAYNHALYEVRTILQKAKELSPKPLERTE